MSRSLTQGSVWTILIKIEEPVDVDVPPVAEAVPPVALTITVMLFPDPASVSNRVDCRLQSQNGPKVHNN